MSAELPAVIEWRRSRNRHWGAPKPTAERDAKSRKTERDAKSSKAYLSAAHEVAESSPKTHKKHSGHTRRKKKIHRVATVRVQQWEVTHRCEATKDKSLVRHRVFQILVHRRLESSCCAHKTHKLRNRKIRVQYRNTNQHTPFDFLSPTIFFSFSKRRLAGDRGILNPSASSSSPSASASSSSLSSASSTGLLRSSASSRSRSFTSSSSRWAAATFAAYCFESRIAEPTRLTPHLFATLS